MEHRLAGLPASPGIVVGPVHLLRWEVPEVRHRIIADEQIEEEVARLRDVVSRAKDRLRRLRSRVETSVGAKEASIFEAQLYILEDPALIESVEEYIRQNLGAEKAFDLGMMEWRQHFARHTQPMVRERVGDLIDVHIRVLSLLLGLPDHDPVDVPKGAGAVLVTHDLTPSLTVQLDREAIAAIATDAGTRTSHVAILARSLGIPAVVGLRDATLRLKGSEQAILDGSRGLLAINPTPEEIAEYRGRAVQEEEAERELQGLQGVASETLDGERVTLRANVDLPDEAQAASHSGAEGVGLMRTEFLVVGRTDMPDEEEQYRAYRSVVEAFGGRPVIVRTFDIGGDKLPVGGHPSEPNPFLGWRAIRMCLDQPELFKVQLRALLRAAMHGDLRILLPLIVSVEEVRAARALIDECAVELEAEGVPFRRDVRLGVMIETPAAALVPESFIGVVDFFSIGTNDLTQYTIAVDRGNADLVSRFTPLHPAILKLIRRVVQCGDAAGIDIAVCGEMASQPLTAFALIGLGVRELSVNPRAVLRVKRIVRAINAEEARAAAEAACGMHTAAEAEEELSRRLMSLVGDVPFMRDGLPGYQERAIVGGLES